MRDLRLLTSRWVDVHGTRIHVRAPRSAPSATSSHVVLVHGIGVSSRYMAPLAVQLSRSFRVSAIDLPGFGLSDKPRPPLDLDGMADALAGWLEAERVERVSLVGNSFGCQVIVRFALRHPAKLARVVLQGPTTDPHASVPRQLARWLRAGNREPFSLNGVIVRDYFDCGLRRVLLAYAQSLADPIREELGCIRVPALVVRGARDPIVTQAWAEEVTSLLPNARLVVVPAAAHAMNYGAPEAFAHAIVTFLHESPTQPEQRATA
jgi:2-hydroxy-6-oxonona-2,4-dienedioate hydrolase